MTVPCRSTLYLSRGDTDRALKDVQVTQIRHTQNRFPSQIYIRTIAPCERKNVRTQVDEIFLALWMQEALQIDPGNPSLARQLARVKKQISDDEAKQRKLFGGIFAK
jgi:hypothetical protein